MSMSRSLRHFLLIYDGSLGRLREDVREFTRSDRAVSEYQEAEKLFSADDNVQVVLVAADSIETVKKTHSNFWHGESIQVLLREFATS